MSEPSPTRYDDGLPRCSLDECGLYDGKRCRALGHRPYEHCEPALEDDYARLTRERDEALRMCKQACEAVHDALAPGLNRKAIVAVREVETCLREQGALDEEPGS